MLGLLRRRFAVPADILIVVDVFAAGLYVGIQVVLAIVLHVRFHAGQIGCGGEIRLKRKGMTRFKRAIPGNRGVG